MQRVDRREADCTDIFTRGTLSGSLSPDYRQFILAVDCFDDGQMNARLYHEVLFHPMELAGWCDWIWAMDWIMTETSFPMQVQMHGRVRKLRERTSENAFFCKLSKLCTNKIKGEERSGPIENAALSGTLATFQINMKSRFYATWQGEVICVETGKRYQFLSFLELLVWIHTLLCSLPGAERLLPGNDSSAVQKKGADFVIEILERLMKEVESPINNSHSQMVDQKLFFSASGAKRPLRIMCHILFMQNRTWQGLVYFKSVSEEYRFRSFLELLMLISGEQMIYES